MLPYPGDREPVFLHAGALLEQCEQGVADRLEILGPYRAGKGRCVVCGGAGCQQQCREQFVQTSPHARLLSRFIEMQAKMNVSRLEQQMAMQSAAKSFKSSLR